MSDADIDAAVRFCDDVLSEPGAPATLEKGSDEGETPDTPALIMKIEIPSKGVWDASDRGRCARSSMLRKVLQPPPAAASHGVVGVGAQSQFESDRCGTVSRKGQRKTSCSSKTSRRTI